jgi:5-methylcytosine-specific restriction endonuclease McrA
MSCDLRFLRAARDRSCPRRTRGFRCHADRVRTRPPCHVEVASTCPAGTLRRGAAAPGTDSLDRYAGPMSEGSPVMDGLPPEHRYDYGGRCWWCGAVADSREHKHKKSDLIREFGSGPYLGDSAVVRGFDGSLRQVQGPGANEVKFPRVLCARCNNARSQPFDLAYDILAAFVADHEDVILKARQFRFSDVYGTGWRSAKDNLAKYYVKHLGCRLVEAGVKVEQPVLDYLSGQSADLTSLELRFEIRSDIVEVFRHLRSRYGGTTGQGLWMGDLFCRYSRSTGAISETQGFLGYRWLRLNYLYTPGIRRPQGSFRRNKVRLPYVASIDPAAVDSEIESS